MNSDIATIIYSYFFVTAATIAGLGYVAKHQVEKHTEEMKEQLNKIMYALYNDGKTGLINKVDHLIEHQQTVRIDVEILKSRFDQ